MHIEHPKALSSSFLSKSLTCPPEAEAMHLSAWSTPPASSHPPLSPTTLRAPPASRTPLRSPRMRRISGSRSQSRCCKGIVLAGARFGSHGIVWVQDVVAFMRRSIKASPPIQAGLPLVIIGSGGAHTPRSGRAAPESGSASGSWRSRKGGCCAESYPKKGNPREDNTCFRGREQHFCARILDCPELRCFAYLCSQPAPWNPATLLESGKTFLEARGGSIGSAPVS